MVYDFIHILLCVNSHKWLNYALNVQIVYTMDMPLIEPNKTLNTEHKP